MKRQTSLTEFLVIGLVVSVLSYAVLKSNCRHRPRETSYRLVCQQQVKDIGRTLETLSYDNNQTARFQLIPPAVNRKYDVLPGTGDGTAEFPDRSMTIPTGTDETHVSSSRFFWTLIREGELSVEDFVCPVSKDAPDPEPDPEKVYDFTSPENISYSLNVSVLYNTMSTDHRLLDYLIPVVADRSPYVNPDIKVPPAGIPATQPRTASTNSETEHWKPYNSPNHHHEGQNILYEDGHTDFSKKPYWGPDKDNMYTTAASCMNYKPLRTGVSMWTARDLDYDWFDPKYNFYAATDALIFP